MGIIIAQKTIYMIMMKLKFYIHYQIEAYFFLQDGNPIPIGSMLLIYIYIYANIKGVY